ncbi:hypothetical protein F8S13_00485 [Chloroflexia bacterium SDU3-3]|nr:hypothetical protein F8S13_00485 [Chloroflexia bacterium SDU3-3]
MESLPFMIFGFFFLIIAFLVSVVITAVIVEIPRHRVHDSSAPARERGIRPLAIWMAIFVLINLVACIALLVWNPTI